MDNEKQGCGDHVECEDRFRTLRWMLGILITMSAIATGFMVKASITATNVKSQLDLSKADYEARFILVQSENNAEIKRLNAEIAQTKSDNNKDLVNAIERVGYEQGKASGEIMRLAQNNQVQLQENKRQLTELSEKVDEIKVKVN